MLDSVLSPLNLAQKQFFSWKFFGQQKLRFDGYIQVLDNKRLLDTLGRVLYWGCVVKMQDFW